MSKSKVNDSKPLDIGLRLNYVKFAIQKGWWIILIGVALGGLIGLVSALRVPNEFEFRTTYVMNPSEARLEFEKLQSETRLLKTLRTDRRFQMARRVDLGWRGMSEMYDESPFDIIVGELPDYYLNKPHKIKLFKDESLEVHWSNGKEAIVSKAQMGEEKDIGPTKVKFLKTKYWNEQRAELEYDVIFWSDEELQRRYSHRLEVIYLVERPHRIELSYTDENKQRGFDFLNAYSKFYLEEQKAANNEGLDELYLSAKKEAENLEQVIIRATSAQGDLEQSNGKMEEWVGISELSDTLDLLLKAEQRLRERGKVWAKLNATNPNFKDVAQELKIYGLTEEDSSIIQVLRDPRAYPKLEDELKKIVQRDKQKQYDLTKRLIEEQNGHARSYALRPFFWAMSSKSDESREGRENALVWERYLLANQEMIEGKLEAIKNKSPMVESDPTHLVLGNAGLKRKQKAIFWAFASFFLAIGVCMVYYSRGKFKRVEQLQLFENFDDTRAWSSKLNDLIERELFANLDIDIGSENKVLAIVSHQKTDELLEFVDRLGQAFSGFGQKCLFVNHPETEKEANITVPSDASSSWWMSNAPEDLIEKERENFDRIIVCLPPLSETPESKGFLRHTDQAFYLILKDHTTTEDLKAWQNTVHKGSIKSISFFIG